MLEQTGPADAADCSLGRARGAAVVVVVEGNPGGSEEAAAQGCIQVCGDGRVEVGEMADKRWGVFLVKGEAASLEEEGEEPLVGLGLLPL